MTHLASRRAFIRGGLTLGAGVALAACTTTNGVTTLNTAAFNENVQAIEAGILSLEAAPAVTAALSAAQLSAFNAALASIRQVSAEVAASSDGAISITTGQGWVRTLETAVSAALAVVTPFLGALPAPVGTIVAAVQALLPVIEAAVGMVSLRATPTMSAAQARAVIARGL